jgi:hypothetical protein
MTKAVELMKKNLTHHEEGFGMFEMSKTNATTVTVVDLLQQLQAGAYTRPLFSSS